MKPAYEDVSVAPNGEVAKELLACTLEEELGYASPDEGVTEIHTAAGAHLETLTSMMTKTEVRGPKQDIGTYPERLAEQQTTLHRLKLQSDKGRILDMIYDEVG